MVKVASLDDMASDDVQMTPTSHRDARSTSSKRGWQLFWLYSDVTWREKILLVYSSICPGIHTVLILIDRLGTLTSMMVGLLTPLSILVIGTSIGDFFKKSRGGSSATSIFQDIALKFVGLGFGLFIAAYFQKSLFSYVANKQSFVFLFPNCTECNCSDDMVIETTPSCLCQVVAARPCLL